MTAGCPSRSGELPVVKAMTAMEEGAIPAPQGTTYPSWVKWVLWLDLVLCGFVALNALVAALQLQGGMQDPAVLRLRALEAASGLGIALFGIAGDVLLLRQRRAGLWAALIALLFVLVSAINTFSGVRYMLSIPEELPCPPEILLAGFALGCFLRIGYNCLYVSALASSWRRLRRDRSHTGTPAA